MSTETIELGCFESLVLGKERTEKIKSFHQEMPDYINRAVAGENKYNLQIDKDWTQFMYESSKMCWKKVLVLILGIAPSLTRFPSFFAQKVLMRDCYLSFYDQNGKYHHTKMFTIEECIKSNGGSQWYDYKYFTTDPEDLIKAVGFFFLLAIPQWIFLALVWARFRNSKYSVWMSSAKIHLTTFSKRLLTLGYSFGCFLLAFGSFIMFGVLNYLGETLFTRPAQTWITPDQKFWIDFDRSIVWSPGAFFSNMLIYTCLLTVLISHIREPIAFFTGFRMYLKKASAVPYNTAAVDFRIKKDTFSWKCINMYYEQCQRYSPHIVLNALTTHFLDLKILQVDKSNVSFDKVKPE